MAHPAILILGPTAGGKSDLALELAMRVPAGGEIVTCDSMQVYRRMDIGTAKPTAEQRRLVRHHLIDLVEPSDDGFSVDRWLALARNVIQDVRSRDRWPIIVGGTNLYVQALLFGLADVPPPDPELRARLHGLEMAELRGLLEGADPEAARRIHPNDRKRTTRALEVFHVTGQRLSGMQTQWGGGGEEPEGLLRATGIPDWLCPLRIVGLDYPPEVINRRINARVKRMMDEGLLEEVRGLRNARAMGRNAREALGYKQLLEHLEGGCSREHAMEQIKIRTRRYAKQQRSWLRRFRTLDVPSLWLSMRELGAQNAVLKALAFIDGATFPPPDR